MKQYSNGVAEKHSLTTLLCMLRLLFSKADCREGGDDGRCRTADEAVKAIPSSGRRGTDPKRREENVIAAFSG